MLWKRTLKNIKGTIQLSKSVKAIVNVKPKESNTILL